MNPIIRKTLFIFFAALFIIAAPSLILYAQGYRLNLPLAPGSKLIVKTGGIFLKTNPKQTDIYINGKLSKQTDFFFGSVLLENLLPRQYKIEIKKPGYQTWQKNLEVKEKEVIEARSITLFPDKLEFSSIEENIGDILASPDQTKIALRGQSADGWNLRMYDLSEGITTKLANQGNFSAKDAAISGWKWSDDSKAVQLAVTAASKTADYSIGIDKTPAAINKIDQDDKTAATSTQEIAIYQNRDNIIYYLGSNGYIYKKPAAGQPQAVTNARIETNPDSKYTLRVFDNYYFVSKDKELYVLTPGAETFKKIFDDLAAEPEISPDGKKVVYFSSSEIWIFFLDDKIDQPPARAGDKQFVIRLSEKISDCHWLNSEYLIFIAGQTVKTAETDTRDSVNIFNLAKISDIAKSESQTAPRLFWDTRTTTAYLFANNSLYRSTPLK